MMRSTDRDADPVQEGADTFLADIGRKVVIRGGYQIMREGARDVLRRGGLCNSASRGLWSLGKSRVSGCGNQWKCGCALQQSPAIGDRHIEVPLNDFVAFKMGAHRLLAKLGHSQR
jgi:hypothetical protein